jgi:hypothetical protein
VHRARSLADGPDEDFVIHLQDTTAAVSFGPSVSLRNSLAGWVSGGRDEQVVVDVLVVVSRVLDEFPLARFVSTYRPIALNLRGGVGSPSLSDERLATPMEAFLLQVQQAVRDHLNLFAAHHLDRLTNLDRLFITEKVLEVLHGPEALDCPLVLWRWRAMCARVASFGVIRVQDALGDGTCAWGSVFAHMPGWYECVDGFTGRGASVKPREEWLEATILAFGRFVATIPEEDRARYQLFLEISRFRSWEMFAYDVGELSQWRQTSTDRSVADPAVYHLMSLFLRVRIRILTGYYTMEYPLPGNHFDAWYDPPYARDAFHGAESAGTWPVIYMGGVGLSGCHHHCALIDEAREPPDLRRELRGAIERMREYGVVSPERRHGLGPTREVSNGRSPLQGAPSPLEDATNSHASSSSTDTSSSSSGDPPPGPAPELDVGDWAAPPVDILRRCVTVTGTFADDQALLGNLYRSQGRRQRGRAAFNRWLGPRLGRWDAASYRAWERGGLVVDTAAVLGVLGGRRLLAPPQYSRRPRRRRVTPEMQRGNGDDTVSGVSGLIRGPAADAVRREVRQRGAPGDVPGGPPPALPGCMKVWEQQRFAGSGSGVPMHYVLTFRSRHLGPPKGDRRYSFKMPAMETSILLGRNDPPVAIVFHPRRAGRLAAVWLVGCKVIASSIGLLRDDGGNIRGRPEWSDAAIDRSLVERGLVTDQEVRDIARELMSSLPRWATDEYEDGVGECRGGPLLADERLRDRILSFRQFDWHEGVCKDARHPVRWFCGFDSPIWERYFDMDDPDDERCDLPGCPDVFCRRRRYGRNRG